MTKTAVKVYLRTRPCASTFEGLRYLRASLPGCIGHATYLYLDCLS